MRAPWRSGPWGRFAGEIDRRSPTAPAPAPETRGRGRRAPIRRRTDRAPRVMAPPPDPIASTPTVPVAIDPGSSGSGTRSCWRQELSRTAPDAISAHPSQPARAHPDSRVSQAARRSRANRASRSRRSVGGSVPPTRSACRSRSYPRSCRRQAVSKSSGSGTGEEQLPRGLTRAPSSRRGVYPRVVAKDSGTAAAAVRGGAWTRVRTARCDSPSGVVEGVGAVAEESTSHSAAKMIVAVPARTSCRFMPAKVASGSRAPRHLTGPDRGPPAARVDTPGDTGGGGGVAPQYDDEGEVPSVACWSCPRSRASHADGSAAPSAVWGPARGGSSPGPP